MEKKMKKCDLCISVARLYCDSDEAILCWDCDSIVHAANFLASKHSRTLLCNSCQAPTSWIGSGSKLGPTLSACEACVDRRFRVVQSEHRLGDLDTVPPSRGGGGIGEEQLQDDDGENQVVPSFPDSSSSRSEEYSNSRRDVASSSRSAGFSRTRKPAEDSSTYQKLDTDWCPEEIDRDSSA